MDVPESQLAYDPVSRRLAIVGGSRQDQASQDALTVILEALGSREPLSGRGLKDALKDSDVGRNQIDAALRFGVRRGVLAVEHGQRNAKLYRRVVSQCPGVSRECPEDTASECPAAYIERDTRTLDFDRSPRGRYRDTAFDPTGAFGEPEDVR